MTKEHAHDHNFDNWGKKTEIASLNYKYLVCSVVAKMTVVAIGDRTDGCLVAVVVCGRPQALTNDTTVAADEASIVLSAEVLATTSPSVCW